VGGETGLMLRLAFGRPWRRTEGLLGSIMDLRLARKIGHKKAIEGDRCCGARTRHHSAPHVA
jgi:hypothetical protein